MMINKLILLATTLIIGFTTISCQKKEILEYGKPIDLEKIDWEKQNLDNLFSKIVYSKKITFKKADSIYKGSKPLRIQWYYKYNTDTTLYANKIREDYFELIQPNKNFLKPYEISRTYVGVSNDELESTGAFGYYSEKSITFDKIETISSGKDNLALIRFNTDIENNPKKALEQYNLLKNVLSKKLKGFKFSTNSLNEYPIYEWKSDKQKFKISLLKGTETSLLKNKQNPKEVYTVFLEIIFYNDKTKEHLRGLY